MHIICVCVCVSVNCEWAWLCVWRYLCIYSDKSLCILDRGEKHDTADTVYLAVKSHFWIETIAELLSSWIFAHCLIYLPLSIVSIRPSCSHTILSPPLSSSASHWVDARKTKQATGTECDICNRIQHNVSAGAHLFVFFCVHLCLYTNTNTKV